MQELRTELVTQEDLNKRRLRAFESCFQAPAARNIAPALVVKEPKEKPLEKGNAPASQEGTDKDDHRQEERACGVLRS